MKIQSSLTFVKIAFIIVTIAGIPIRLVCQPGDQNSAIQTKYSLGAGIGINDFHMKDKYISPDIMNGIIFSSGLFFEANLGKTKHTAELNFGKGTLSTDDPRHEITQHVGSVSYSYYRSVNFYDVCGSPLEFSLGGGLSSFVMNTDFNVKSSLGLGKNYDQSWYWSHSLNFLIRGDYSLSNNQSLSVQFAMPVFKIVSRPANGHWLDKRNNEVLGNSFLNSATQGRREFFWDNFVLYCSVTYNHKIAENIDLACNFKFNFISSQTPLTMKTYMNNLLIGLNFSF